MNIRVDLNYTIKDGVEVVFRSPVDCSQVTGLKVYYREEDGNTASREFAFADAHGNNVGDIDHLFAENVVVKVILDVTTGMAFVQNADTNAYLEGRFAECLAAANYYTTAREEVGEEHDAINADYIFGLYNELMKEHSVNVKKLVWVESTKSWSTEWEKYNPVDGTFVNYQYVISTGEYRKDDVTFPSDEHIEKPKYLVLSGIHGDERVAALSLYRFIRDVLNGHNVPPAFKEGVVLHIMPVGNPSGFDAFTRYNDNKVDINRNFYHDGEWVQEWFDDEDEDDVKNDFTNGASAASEKETQAISKWLSDNTDADLFLDCHNLGSTHEVVTIISTSEDDATDMAKKIALQGIDRIIPYWRDVIGYPPVETKHLDENGKYKVRDVIFSNPATFIVESAAIHYALNTLGIPSIAAEMSVFYGNYSDWVKDKKVYPPETIAAGAEAIGNILIELYEQSFFGEVVDDMKAIDNKLDILVKSASFRTESGVMVVSDNKLPESGASSITVKIPCSNGAKMFVFWADDKTFQEIEDEYKKTSPVQYVATVFGNCFEPGIRNYYHNTRSYMSMMKYTEGTAYHNGWFVYDYATTVGNTDGATFSCFALKEGTYNWTAYYWND